MIIIERRGESAPRAMTKRGGGDRPAVCVVGPLLFSSMSSVTQWDNTKEQAEWRRARATQL
jgi:hypothetical protein